MNRYHVRLTGPPFDLDREQINQLFNDLAASPQVSEVAILSSGNCSDVTGVVRTVAVDPTHILNIFRDVWEPIVKRVQPDWKVEGHLINVLNPEN